MQPATGRSSRPRTDFPRGRCLWARQPENSSPLPRPAPGCRRPFQARFANCDASSQIAPSSRTCPSKWGPELSKYVHGGWECPVSLGCSTFGPSRVVVGARRELAPVARRSAATTWSLLLQLVCCANLRPLPRTRPAASESLSPLLWSLPRARFQPRRPNPPPVHSHCRPGPRTAAP